MDWFLLALLCAFSLASADALTKRWLSDYPVRELVVVRTVLPALVLAPLLFIVPLPPLPARFWLGVALLLPLEILAMALYMRAIRDSPLALTLPYLAFTPVFTTVTGGLILGERVSMQGFAGIVLVVAGAWALNFDGPGNPRAGGALWRETGSRYMLLVALIYSLTSVLGKGLLQYLPPQSFGPVYFILFGSTVLVLYAGRRPAAIRLLWRRPGPHLAIGLLLGIMVLTHYLAIARVEAAYMIAVKRTSLLFGIVYGAVWFGEARFGQHLLAGALMVAGVALIVL